MKQANNTLSSTKTPPTRFRSFSPSCEGDKKQKISFQSPTRSRGIKGEFSGFTLVELIVVITILVILGTIAFTSLTGFSGNARDSDRVTTLKNIESGLDIHQIKSGSYPVPESITGTGTINGNIFSSVWEIGDTISRIIRINKIPTDPLSKTNYVYGTNSSQSQYQIATTLENAIVYNNLIPTVYADTSLQARVNGNYSGYIKYGSGTDTWIANIPSLLFNNTGSTNLLATGTYFVVNKQQNLPYKLDDKTQIQNKNPNDIIKAITNTSTATLTGVNITAVIATNTSTGVSAFFTGELLASFWGNIAVIETAVLGKSASVAPPTPTYTDCTFNSTPVSHAIAVTAYLTGSVSFGNTCTSEQRTCTNGTLGGTYTFAACTVAGATGSFTLSQTSVTLGTNPTISNNCSTAPTSYTSSDTAVATVAGTVITTLSAGTTDITPVWGACADNGAKTLTVTTPTCTSWTYTAYGTCQPNNTQTRTVLTSSPANCTGGSPVLSQSCVYDWRVVDANCIKPDVVVGSQTWAGCNSTIGSTAIAYGQTSCYNYAGGAMTCTAPPWGKTVSTMTEADYLAGQSNNIYGALYQWDTMSTNTCLGTGIVGSNTACPCKAGYHLPTNAEWDTLETTLGCSGSEKLTGDSVGWECLVSNTADTTNGLGWTSTNANSLKNKLGFTLAGYCSSGGSCTSRGYYAFYWSSSVYAPSPTNSWRRSLNYSYASVVRHNDAQTYDFSVRCLKD